MSYFVIINGQMILLLRKKVVFPCIYTVMMIIPMPNVVAMDGLQNVGANVAFAGSTILTSVVDEIAQRGEGAARNMVSRSVLGGVAYGLRRAQVPVLVILSMQLLACPLVEEGISDPLIDGSRSYIHNVIDRMRLSPEERANELAVQKHIEDLRKKNYHYGKALFNLYKDYRNDSDVHNYILGIKKEDVAECDEHYVKSLYKAWIQRRLQDISEGPFLLETENHFVRYPLLLVQDAFVQNCMMPYCNRKLGITANSYQQDREHLEKTIDRCDQSKKKVYTAILERSDCDLLLPTIAQQNRQFGLIKTENEYSREQVQKLTRFFGDTRIQFNKLNFQKKEKSEDELEKTNEDCRKQKLKDFFGENYVPPSKEQLGIISVKDNTTTKPYGIVGFAQSVYAVLSNSVAKVATIALIDIACRKIFLPKQEYVNVTDKVPKSPEDILMESRHLVTQLNSVQRCQ